MRSERTVVKYDRATLLDLIRTAEAMITGSITPLEGSRKIARLRDAMREERNELFDPFEEINYESSDLRIADSPLWSDEIPKRYSPPIRRL